MEIDNRYLSKDYGLINAFPDREGTDENAPLYSIEYLLLKDEINLSNNLDRFIRWSFNLDTNAYNQRPNNNGSHEDYMSPDQLIAFVAFFNFEGANFKDCTEDIWKYLKRHLFTYDNLTGEINFKRLMQPLAVFFVWYSATGNLFAKWGMILSCWKSCREFYKNPQAESSGVLKAFVCLRSLGIEDEYCEQFFEHAFEVYFPSPEHPIRKVLTEI